VQSPLFLEKEEDIDIKIRLVSKRIFRFQLGNFGFKVLFSLKSAKIISFVAPPGLRHFIQGLL